MTVAIEFSSKGDMLVTPPRYPSKEVKEVLGGRWDSGARAWKLPPTAMNVAQLVEWYGVDLLEGAPVEVLELWKERWGFPGFEVHEDLRARAEAHPRWEDLYPFQREAVEYLVCNPHYGALLGLSPGLGKTVVATIAMDVLQACRVLVLAPPTLVRNWIVELEAWSSRTLDVTRATAESKDPGPEVTVTNFETVMEVVHRDEHGKVVDKLYYDQERDLYVGATADQFYPYPTVGGPTHFKNWREQGPKKRNQQDKLVPARERITQARRSYAAVDWDLVVIDESILFKNRKAVKVAVVEQLTKSSERVFLLSGSAVAKYKDDLYPQLKLVMPRAFPSYWRFAEYFCIVDRGQWGWSIEGDRPGVDLHEMLKDFLHVVDQSEVLPDLPDYVTRPLALDLNPRQQKAHDEMMERWIVELEEEPEESIEAPNRLAQMTRLQQITSNLCCLRTADGGAYPNSSVKEDALVELIHRDEVEFPLLVWVNYIPTGESYVSRLREEFPKLSVGMAKGAASARDRAAREEMIQSFKEGELDVLVMQLDVGKFGHTFTQTRTVYYGDRSTNSDSIIQSLRRVRRIGLTHSPVLIVPRCPGTIDDVVELNLEGKFGSIAEVTRASLLELLYSLGRR